MHDQREVSVLANIISNYGVWVSIQVGNFYIIYIFLIPIYNQNNL